MLAHLDHIYKSLKSNDQALNLCERTRRVLYQLLYSSTDVRFFNEYLLGTYHVPGTGEGANSRVMNKTDNGSALTKLVTEYRPNPINTQDVFGVLSALKTTKQDDVTESWGGGLATEMGQS